MPDAFLYVLPETHTNQQHQDRKKALADLAGWGAVNLLCESVLFTDTSAQGSNIYGVEEEASIRRANALLHYINSVKGIQNLNQKVKDAQPGVPAELLQARQKARGEVTGLGNKGFLKQQVKQDLEDYVDEFPVKRMSAVEEKYLFYKRNHKIAKNILAVLRQVLGNPGLPRVFALSIGEKHIDSSTLNPGLGYQGKKDLPTILGSQAIVDSKTVAISYGPTSVEEIAKKALELSDTLQPWLTRLSAQARLKVYVNTGW